MSYTYTGTAIKAEIAQKTTSDIKYKETLPGVPTPIVSPSEISEHPIS